MYDHYDHKGYLWKNYINTSALYPQYQNSNEISAYAHKYQASWVTNISDLKEISP